MGFFSFLKNISSSNNFVCDFIDGLENYKSATLTFFGDGSFAINSDTYKADFLYVKDIGMSRDMKYERIEAGGWWFYTSVRDKPKLMKCLNDARTTFIAQSMNTVPYKDFKQDYLAIGMDFLEVPIIFNVQGVSYNYKSDTRKIISQMYIGSILNLKYWPDAPDNEHIICVFDDHLRQIGYLPISDSPFGIELQKQFKSGISYSATVLEKGIVQDTDIWWCKAELTLRAPYPKDSKMVFSNGFGGAYHCRCGCCKADWEIPMYWADRCNMRPCKRCHKTETK